MKKKFFILIMAVLTFLKTPIVYAQKSNFTYQIPSPTKYKSLEDVVSALGSLIQPVFILTFLAMILYGAWIRLTSRGDVEKLTKSRNIIISAVIGFALAVLAPSVVNIITGLLGVTGLETLQTN
jgi:hypothetical protein